MARIVCRTAQRFLVGLGLALAATASPGGPSAPASGDRMRAFTVDVGTGLGMYFELPGGPEGRPWRIVYDTGKGQSSGTDNDMVSFLVSPTVGLKPASEGFEGDVIDYFVLSHPHEDHFNGAIAVFESFDVRNVIESKQILNLRYLARFKVSAMQEILAARERGLESRYYVVALPYPNGFDQPRDGQPFDEYELVEGFLPGYLKGKVDPRKGQGKVRFPFGPDQVAQPVEVPVNELIKDERVLKKLDPEFVEGVMPIDVLPVGTQFALGREGGFTVLHGDTVAALDPENVHDESYRASTPYYREADLNDSSVAIRVHYKATSIMVPGDAEGRDKRPSSMLHLADLFGTGEDEDAYTAEEMASYLRMDRPEGERLPLLPGFERYVMAGAEMLELFDSGYVTLDRVTPEDLEVAHGDKEWTIKAKKFESPGDVPDGIIGWAKGGGKRRETVHPEWKERLLRLHQDLALNRQKMESLRNRFLGWLKGAKPRLDKDGKSFRLIWDKPVYTITNLVNITERVFYVDPSLANLLAGFVLRSDEFLDYLAPEDRSQWAKRGERHMLDVADQIKAESGIDILKSDVLVFGHHGSFTSGSLGFVLRVDPNVGIISADDKNYTGSTLPDFSALFWNMNSHHPKARALLHSLFFHADLLARKRGEPVDGYAERNRYSQSAARVFRRRRRWPIPLWRTDFNDDLTNVNTLTDNIAIETDGSAPIWAFARHIGKDGKDALPEDAAANPDRYRYWSQELVGSHPAGSPEIRPHDPSGVIRTFAVEDRLEESMALRGIMPAPRSELEELADESYEDWTHDHE